MSAKNYYAHPNMINETITCPIDGLIPLHSVTIYNESLRKQTFSISPILPVCNICESEVEIKGNTQGITLILLNGTCGSGKSTTAEELLKSHGFLAIDGDCVLQVVRHKLGLKHVDFDSNEVFEEICKQIDILSAIGNKIVITHIVMPNDLQKYKNLFLSKGINFRVILLKPRYEIAVERTKTRTCFGSITPEEWVYYFYDKLAFADDEIEVIDNSELSVEQAALTLIKGMPH